MNQKQLNRYCDQVLRILNKSGNDGSFLFGTGAFRKEEGDDFFVKIKISEEDTIAIILALENEHNYITTDAKEHSNYYDLEKKEYIKSALYAIKITDAGRDYIQTSSLFKRPQWENIKLRPYIPNLVSVVAMFISIIACIISFSYLKKEEKELTKQKEEFSILMKDAAARQLLQMDSLLEKKQTDDSLNIQTSKHI